MVYLLLIAILMLLTYIAYKMQEINIRTIILDIRARIVSLHIRNPKVSGSYETIFNRELKNFDSKMRDKIVAFTRKHDYDLAHLMTASQMAQHEENQKKNPGLIPE